MTRQNQGQAQAVIATLLPAVKAQTLAEHHRGAGHQAQSDLTICFVFRHCMHRLVTMPSMHRAVWFDIWGQATPRGLDTSARPGPGCRSPPAPCGRTGSPAAKPLCTVAPRTRPPGRCSPGAPGRRLLFPGAVPNAHTLMFERTSNSYSSSGLSGRGKLPTVADDSSTFLPAACKMGTIGMQLR